MAFTGAWVEVGDMRGSGGLCWKELEFLRMPDSLGQYRHVGVAEGWWLALGPLRRLGGIPMDICVWHDGGGRVYAS